MRTIYIFAIVLVVLVVLISMVTMMMSRDPTYVGCYSDSDTSRAFLTSKSDVTPSQCNELAKQAKSPYFALQYWNNGKGLTDGTTTECWYNTNNWTTPSGLTPSSNCGPNNKYNTTSWAKTIAPGWTNALYKTGY